MVRAAAAASAERGAGRAADEALTTNSIVPRDL